VRKVSVSIALGAAMVSTVAAAQYQGGRGGWGQRDQTRAEARQRADMMFQMIDANHDGVVTKAEADQALAQFQSVGGGRGSARMQMMMQQAFATSPSLTLQQFEAQSLARFDAADLNHDGVVSAAERQQARSQQVAPAPPAVAPQPVPAKPQ
jgi:hypothetical protein